MRTVLACPVCGAELSVGASAAACPNAHAFDRARSGYLNLLLSNKKQSAEPGDSPAMLQSRRAFLQGGFYDQMAVAANAAVLETLAGRTESHVADLGCGEGFFTARLKHALAAVMSPPPACYGVDISRPGIKMATAYDREITWIVASLHRSPFRPRSLDVGAQHVRADRRRRRAPHRPRRRRARDGDAGPRSPRRAPRHHLHRGEAASADAGADGRRHAVRADTRPRACAIRSSSTRRRRS